MRDRDVFRQVETLRRRDRTAETTALALAVHARVAEHCAASPYPTDSVTDTDLDAIAAPYVTTMAAVELCLAGLWRRVDDGYVVVDADYLASVRAGTARVGTWQRLAAAGRRVWTELNSERFIP